MENQRILTQKGKDKIEHESCTFTYEKSNRNRDKKFWRCDQRGSSATSCIARLHTDMNNRILKQINHHNHGGDIAKVEAQKRITTLKRRAVETAEQPCQLRANVLENTTTPVLAAMPSKNATKKIIKRARHEILVPPPAPQTLAQTFEIPDAYCVYVRGPEMEEQFLLADSGVYQESGRDQRRGNWVFPICHALLTTKTKTTYERLFNMLKNAWPRFQPESFTIDFEDAIIGAIKSVFGAGISIKGCFFHLVQNFHRRIAGLEAEEGELTILQVLEFIFFTLLIISIFDIFSISRRYRSDPVFAESAKMITSLAFIPPEHLTQAIVQLEYVIPDELQPVMDWFLINYTGRPLANGGRTRPRFSVDIWNLYQRTIDQCDRTNNYSESSHHRLRRLFSCSHPSLWRFIDLLRAEQKLLDADYARFVAGEEPPPKKKKFRDADVRILRKVRNYDRNNINNILEYLRGISRNYVMDPGANA